jgi:hypothetical protein
MGCCGRLGCGWRHRRGKGTALWSGVDAWFGPLLWICFVSSALSVLIAGFMACSRRGWPVVGSVLAALFFLAFWVVVMVVTVIAIVPSRCLS